MISFLTELYQFVFRKDLKIRVSDESDSNVKRFSTKPTLKAKAFSHSNTLPDHRATILLNDYDYAFQASIQVSSIHYKDTFTDLSALNSIRIFLSTFKEVEVFSNINNKNITRNDTNIYSLASLHWKGSGNCLGHVLMEKVLGTYYFKFIFSDERFKEYLEVRCKEYLQAKLPPSDPQLPSQLQTQLATAKALDDLQENLVSIRIEQGKRLENLRDMRKREILEILGDIKKSQEEITKKEAKESLDRLSKELTLIIEQQKEFAKEIPTAPVETEEMLEDTRKLQEKMLEDVRKLEEEINIERIASIPKLKALSSGKRSPSQLPPKNLDTSEPDDMSSSTDSLPSVTSHITDDGTLGSTNSTPRGSNADLHNPSKDILQSEETPATHMIKEIKMPITPSPSIIETKVNDTVGDMEEKGSRTFFAFLRSLLSIYPEKKTKSTVQHPIISEETSEKSIMETFSKVLAFLSFRPKAKQEIHKEDIITPTPNDANAVQTNAGEMQTPKEPWISADKHEAAKIRYHNPRLMI